jgi:chorismate synthase
MSSSIGENLKMTIFGQSHSAAIGMTLEGFPAGFCIDQEKLIQFLQRRAPGKNAWSTPRKEADEPEFLSGLVGNTTCGAPLTAVIRNHNTRPQDYSMLKDVPRPGHADYTAEVKYHGFQDASGGGHFSGRLTAPLCIAGGICRQFLSDHGIQIQARIAAIGGICDEGEMTGSVAEKEFPTVSDERGVEMKKKISDAKEKGDSIGGIIECTATGLPAGLGDPIFGGMESRISAILFGIPAVKGVEFGAGFGVAAMTGSQNNDPFFWRGNQIETETNHAGGILGGITTGMPLVVRTAFKPTPSISREQTSISLSQKKTAQISVPGRHDPCIVPRAVPVVEAAVSFAVLDAWIGRKKEL